MERLRKFLDDQDALFVFLDYTLLPPIRRACVGMAALMIAAGVLEGAWTYVAVMSVLLVWAWRAGL